MCGQLLIFVNKRLSKPWGDPHLKILGMDAVTKFLQTYLPDNPTDPATLALLRAHAQEMQVSRRTTLVEAGHTHPYVYFILAGAARSYVWYEGEMVNKWFAFEQELVGSIQSLDQAPAKESIEAMEDLTLLRLNLRQLAKAMVTSLPIALLVNNVLMEYVRFLEEKSTVMQHYTAEQRYAHLLVREPMVAQRISITHIASYLGVSRETLSRIRGKKLL
jgi:CRP-like cAMP-binding protein